MGIRRNSTFIKRCKVCAEAVISSRIYCNRLEEYVDDLVYCPYFQSKSVVNSQAIS